MTKSCVCPPWMGLGPTGWHLKEQGQAWLILCRRKPANPSETHLPPPLGLLPRRKDSGHRSYSKKVPEIRRSSKEKLTG